MDVQTCCTSSLLWMCELMLDDSCSYPLHCFSWPSSALQCAAVFRRLNKSVLLLCGAGTTVQPVICISFVLGWHHLAYIQSISRHLMMILFEGRARHLLPCRRLNRVVHLLTQRYASWRDQKTFRWTVTAHVVKWWCRGSFSITQSRLFNCGKPKSWLRLNFD